MLALGAAVLLGAAAGYGVCRVHMQRKNAPLFAELHAQEQRAKILSDNLIAAVLLQDGSGKIFYCSPFTEVLTGYSSQEITGNGGDFLESVMHPDDLGQYRRALEICRSGEAFQFRYRIYHRSGIEIWVETRTVPILDDDGAVSSFLSITLDVTGMVRYQKQVEEKNRDLQDFAYMVSHDLKAPIFTIKGMLGIIRDDYAPSMPADSKEVIEHIERAAQRLEQLVSRVLEYSRISNQELKLLPVDLNLVLADVQRDFKVQSNDAGAVISIDARLPTVLGDQLQLYRVFANLVGNAIKYRDPARSAEIRVNSTASRDSRYARIEVADNGQGIPQDKLESVFRPFHRLHGAAIEGTGLGLATVKKLIEKSGGTVELSSTVGQGSTFAVSLKLAPAETAQ